MHFKMCNKLFLWKLSVLRLIFTMCPVITEISFLKYIAGTQIKTCIISACSLHKLTDGYKLF